MLASASTLLITSPVDVVVHNLGSSAALNPVWRLEHLSFVGKLRQCSGPASVYDHRSGL